MTTWQRLKCAINKHDYQLLGTHFNDEVYGCKHCGQKHTKPYTLRINRLGR